MHRYKDVVGAVVLSKDAPEKWIFSIARAIDSLEVTSKDDE